MQSKIKNNLTIIIPARNESANLGALLSEIRDLHPEISILVIDDGSTDNTGDIAFNGGANVVRHPYSMGNGAAIKTGARNAKTEYLLFMDADGQHNPADIDRMVDAMGTSYKMVVGARAPASHATRSRRAMNHIYNRIASIMTGYEIPDLTSGFRLVEARYFRQFIYLLPNGFSYPTTITMSFLRAALPIKFIEIIARQREGKSKIRPMRDGMRFLVIIMKIGALFSPMRLFFPISLGLFTAGFGYYIFTFATQGRFTNMGVVLFIASIIVFLIGIISEQISSLHYRYSSDDRI